MSEEDKIKSSGASGSSTITGLNISVKSTARSSQPAEKRSHSEVIESSFGDEITMLNKQIEQMNSDLQETRDSIKGLLSKEEMKDFIISTIEALKFELEKKIDKDIEVKVGEKVEEKLKEKTTELHSRLDMLVYENVQLKEEVENLKKTADEALQRSNYNEQYSRKNNVKIMGITESPDETEESLTDKVLHILSTKAKVNVNPYKIMALHRIPGKAGMTKPVLLKLMNNSEKTKIMRKRKEMKGAGYKLVDDVTRSNSKLINKLLLHEKIDSAWYFNGSVFGKTKAGKRHKFDICSDIDEVIDPKTADPEK